jgi:hypothetical protein
VLEHRPGQGIPLSEEARSQGTTFTQLGHCRINGADGLTVQLLRPDTMPAIGRTLHLAVVRVLWPLQPSIIDPKQFADVAAVIVRMFAAASTELAAIKARKRPL